MNGRCLMVNRKSQIANRKSLRGVNYEITNYYMQNKPNLLSARMNITSAITKNYENISPTKKCENKPNQTQFQYQICENKPNRTQFQPKNEANKPNQTQFYPPPADSKAKITCLGTICRYNHRFRINLGEFLCVNNAAAAKQTHSRPSKKR